MGSSFAPNLELIASSGFASPFGQLFKGNTRMLQILPDKDCGRLHILLILLNAKGIIASSECQKERCAATGQRVQNPEPLSVRTAIVSGKDGYIEEHTGEDLIGLALIATRLRHFQR